MVCGVSQGDPPLQIHWLKDGAKLPSHLAVNVSTLDLYSSLLSISSLTEAHSGEYTCVASNPAARVRYTSKLQVKGKSTSSLLWMFFLSVALAQGNAPATWTPGLIHEVIFAPSFCCSLFPFIFSTPIYILHVFILYS